ncbi:MAG: hypothetical protein QOF13_1514 [Solirubrobacterales bacterium]|jgi:hypothetical protein|nr:hypothetical protein [Solirubrobacterales bacterium]
MSRRRLLASLAAALSLCALGALWPAAAAAAAAPAWALTLTPMPGAFAPGATSEYLVSATNVGASQTSAQTTVVEVTLPATVTPLKVTSFANSDPGSEGPDCKVEGQAMVCKTTETVPPGRVLQAAFSVAVPSGLAGQEIEAQASISGGGANSLQASVLTPVQSEPLPFGFLADSSAHLTEEDGSPNFLGGSHPYQATIRFGFPTESIAGKLTGAGHPRDIALALPRGLIGNPAASPVLCTEAELTSQLTPGCPEESQVGVVDVTTLVGEGFGKGGGTVISSDLYSMVPPPGAPAEVATDVAGVGFFVHFLGTVRSDSDYAVEAYTRDLLALTIHPIFNSQAQLWGDPSATAHDGIRGDCRRVGGTCPFEFEDPQPAAFLTAPGDCPGEAPVYEAFADSWEEPGQERRSEFEGTDLAGNPIATEDCGALEFEPTFQSRPTTNLTDTPSGLTFQLHLPQDTDLGSPAKAALRDALVTFPPGMAVNPSQASGLEACSLAQIGFEGGTSFSREPQSCPDASKLGTVEASSPVLVRRNAKHEVEVDPESGEPVPEPLHGAIYLAQPFANPFGKLVATYLVVEDEKTGIVAKLAGEGQLDPQSGQITVSFRENPELPIEDIEVKLFGGARGSLLTPPTCGSHATSADFTPWSAPVPVHQADSFVLAAAAGGGPCPAGEAGMPHAPALRAGTLAPAAGKFSPLLFKLSRSDGSQRMAKIDATLPVGLSAKLAGVGQCSEAAIAKARSREVPNQGAAELADPSCPAASQVGTIVVSAGGGPTPYHTTGNAYLAGPYKGAPLSVVAIASAVAGPFDLGTVAVRSALHLDPETAQARIVSDPLPQIIHGVPVDVRSVSVDTDRPEFTLNPTSCAEKSFGGAVTSALGQIAPIFERFQVGGCSALPFKPKLSARLFGPIHRGGHPRLRAVLTAKPGEANIASLAFTLPHSEFIDQAHFRTICTRVQFKANQCPAGAVYGHVTAYSPLLDYPLEGPVFLRSSVHKLPDAVAALHGPPSQPIALEGAARVDSVKGRLRARVETFPDAPVSKVVVVMQGGKKGLFQNSTNICKNSYRVVVSFVGQNGKAHKISPALEAQCGRGGGKGKHRSHRR